MNEQAVFQVDVLEEKTGYYNIRGLLQDDTEFFLWVPRTEVTLFDEGRRGWLNVVYSGESNGVASITLPAPILDKGHRISVSTSRIKRALYEDPRTQGETKAKDYVIVEYPTNAAKAEKEAAVKEALKKEDDE